jgi:DNA replication protein DnaC
MSGLREEAVQQYCKVLHLPTVGSQFVRMAEEAVKQQHGPIRYLEALLAAELEEREQHAVTRRIFEAKLPRRGLIFLPQISCSLTGD